MIQKDVMNSNSRKPGFPARSWATAWMCMAGLVLSLASIAQAYDSQSDGSDGALTLSPGQEKEIDLSMAATGPWNTPGTGFGVYDPEQWAVVFKYSSVTIPNGATVKFKNHPKNPPVVWLASGNVSISGTVSLDGGVGLNDSSAAAYAIGGPGGYPGGIRGGPQSNGTSSGFGPGGGGLTNNCCSGGGGGGYATLGSSGNGASGAIYGSPLLSPLIGGSGGGGDGYNWRGGGGGGGAILIASSSQISVNQGGTIRANGGVVQNSNNGWGSGGGIRLICDNPLIAGAIRALQGPNPNGTGAGRIRIETLSGTFAYTGSGESNPTASVGLQGPLFPPENAPKLRIVSINSVNAPGDPLGSISQSEDVLISSNTTTVAVVVEALNVTVQAGMMVSIRVVAANAASQSFISPQLIDQGNGTARATATNVTIPQGRSVVQLRLVLPQ